MKIVFSSFDWMEAQAVAGLLEGSGLKAVIWGAEAARMNISFGQGGGVKVAVPDDQLSDALALVEDYRRTRASGARSSS